MTPTCEGIHVDGNLIESCWSEANWITDFMQMEPDRLSDPSEKTVVKVLYDDEAIYFAFRCYDSQPENIKTSLRRRDEEPPADWVVVGLDSRDDNQTAFVFKMNAGGLMRDIYVYNDGNEEDDSWNAVWEGETTVDDSGWVAEMKIPFTAVRFPPAEQQVWGMNLGREIHRTNEELLWSVFPREEKGDVSHFGELRGIADIPQPFNMEILPYGYSKYERTSSETDYNSDFGADLKYSLSSGVILNATFNPDFGQIEADPSVLNLGVFETYYPEKRPFFLEGSSLFDTPFTLFYSRRIGQSPGYYDIYDDEEIVSEPENTTILGAAKITGKTANGVSFGIVEALTSREYAIVENEDGESRDALIEPITNYWVGRITKDIWKGNSSIGAIATSMNREAGMSAYTGGVDWMLYFNDNDYYFMGQTAISDRGDTPGERESGYGIYSRLSKTGGKHHNFHLIFEAESPDFNIWDMGFLGRNDYLEGYAEYMFRTRDPVGIFRRTVTGIETWQAWNYDGNHISNGIGLWTNLRYMNFWDTNFGVHYNFPRYSDMETRGGPLLKPPGNYGGWFWAGTDWRKNLRPQINFWAGKNESQSWWWGCFVKLLYRPVDKLETSVSFTYEKQFDENQWVENIEDEADSTHYTFGRLDQREWNMTVRASYNFTRDISLQVYTQPFIAVGKYKEYVELAEPGTYKFQLFDPGDNYDFNIKEMNFNLVFRWEYAPGSTVYAVWNRGMSDDENPGHFNLNNNIDDLFNAPPNDIFMLKVNKWFDF